MFMTESVNVLVVIPLRLASARIPRKVLAPIGELTLAERTVGRALEAVGYLSGVAVVAAVDSEEVAHVLESRYPELTVIRTDPDLPSGTDRVFAATRVWIAEEPSRRAALKGVLNVQGDMPFAGLNGLRQAVEFYQSAEPADLARFPMLTLAQPWPAEMDFMDLAAVKVIADRAGRAIYFSRHPIPHSRVPAPRKGQGVLGAGLHIGLYGYTLEALAAFASQSPVPMELSEGLEQLRALWLGLGIFVIQTTPESGEDFRGIDTPKDLAWARKFAGPTGGSIKNVKRAPSAKRAPKRHAKLKVAAKKSAPAPAKKSPGKKKKK
jgi:3-deoxy-manno-octulosonate cytidylyltransferase (CMP-KDO synthetase)